MKHSDIPIPKPGQTVKAQNGDVIETMHLQNVMILTQFRQMPKAEKGFLIAWGKVYYESKKPELRSLVYFNDPENPDQYPLMFGAGADENHSASQAKSVANQFRIYADADNFRHKLPAGTLGSSK